MAHEGECRGVLTAKTARLPQRRRHLRALMLYIMLLIAAVVALLPFFWMLSTSLMTRGETISRQWLPRVPQVQNYAVAWTEGQVRQVFPQQRAHHRHHASRAAEHLYTCRLCLCADSLCRARGDIYGGC